MAVAHIIKVKNYCSQAGTAIRAFVNFESNSDINFQFIPVKNCLRIIFISSLSLIFKHT